MEVEKDQIGFILERTQELLPGAKDRNGITLGSGDRFYQAARGRIILSVENLDGGFSIVHNALSVSD